MSTRKSAPIINVALYPTGLSHINTSRPAARKLVPKPNIRIYSEDVVDRFDRFCSEMQISASVEEAMREWERHVKKMQAEHERRKQTSLREG